MVDSLVYSADAISYAFNALFIQLANVPKFEDSNNFDNTPIFLYCWSIIDEVNAALQIVSFYQRKMGNSGPKTQQLTAKMKKYNTLRRNFRHIHQQIKNIAKSKSKDAIIGSIAWIAWPDPNKHEFRSYVIKKGFLHGVENLPIVNPGGLSLLGPVSHIEFTAYGVTVKFYDLIEEFSIWMDENFDQVRDELRKKFALLAQDHAMNEEDLWKSSGSGFTGYLGFSLNNKSR